MIQGFGVESSGSNESDKSSGNTNSTESLYPNFQKAKGFHAVPPPTGTVIPPRANVSFTGIDELAIRNKVVNQENTKSSQPEIDRNKVIIEDWVDSDDEETVLNFSEIQKKTVLNSENSETSFENRSPKSQDSVGQGSRKKGLGHKGGKTCFVCYSPDHLIKDCNLHERTFKQTQTHKPKGTQGSRDTRPVWNNINRVNHSNFSGNSRYPHQKRSFIPSAVLTREGLKSTARPKITQTVPSKRTAKVFYQGTARPRVPQAVLSQSTGRPYYPRMDNRRPRISSFSPSSRSSITRTPYRPQRPKKIIKSIWVKKGSTVESQAVFPQNVSVKERAMIKPTQTWRPKGDYLDSVNRGNGSYTLKQFEYVTPLGVSKSVMTWGLLGRRKNQGKGTIKTSCIDFEKVSYVEELKFNLLSVSQICDKKHNVLFTDKECLILSPSLVCGLKICKYLGLAQRHMAIEAVLVAKSYIMGTNLGAKHSIALGTAEAQGADDIPHSPMIILPQMSPQTSGRNEDFWFYMHLNREVRRLKKQTLSQPNRFNAKGQNQNYEDVFVAVTPDLERKSDETEQVTIEEEKDAFDVKSGDTEELDLEEIQSTARPKVAVTPQDTLNFEDEHGSFKSIRPIKKKSLKKTSSKYPQMKELYDKVQESIKDSFKDFIPIGSEKEEQMLKERDAKRLLKERKATVTEEQPSNEA
ncbi:hypothetical protein Tco_0241186 [Tanacetum coccineum]